MTGEIFRHPSFSTRSTEQPTSLLNIHVAAGNGTTTLFTVTLLVSSPPVVKQFLPVGNVGCLSGSLRYSTAAVAGWHLFGQALWKARKNSRSRVEVNADVMNVRTTTNVPSCHVSFAADLGTMIRPALLE
jgi:hypothetical protein